MTLGVLERRRDSGIEESGLSSLVYVATSVLYTLSQHPPFLLFPPWLLGLFLRYKVVILVSHEATSFPLSGFSLTNNKIKQVVDVRNKLSQ